MEINFKDFKLKINLKIIAIYLGIKLIADLIEKDKIKNFNIQLGDKSLTLNA